MNVSLQIIDVLDYIGRKFGIMIDWTQETAQPYIQALCKNIIQYEVWTSIFWIVIIGVIFFVGTIITIASHPFAKKVNWDFDCLVPWVEVLGVVIMLFFGVAFIVVTGRQILDIITAYTLPETTILKFFENVIIKLNS